PGVSDENEDAVINVNIILSSLSRSNKWSGVPSAAGRWLLAGLVLFSAAALIGAHLYVGFRGPGFRGPLLVLDHLFELSLVLALLALCAGVGRFALTQCRVTLNQPLEALSFSTALGAGLVATSILVCGLLSALEAPVLGLLVLVWAFLARKELGALPSLCAHSWAVLRTRTGVVGLSIAGAIGLFMISQALAPPIDWDSLMYHLRVPAQFAQEGRVYLTEDNLNGAFVGLVHMLYVPLLALGSSAGPALVSAVLALLLGAAVLAFCVRFLDGPTSALSLSLLSGSTILLLTAITARVDVTLAVYVFLAH